MEIEDYRKQFIDEIRNDASLEGSDPKATSSSVSLQILKILGNLAILFLCQLKSGIQEGKF